jgi:hypothetical protein
MGYTNASTSMFSPDIKQAPENLYRIRNIAGWTIWECADALGVDASLFHSAENLGVPMPDDTWRKFVDKAGRRSFDHDEDSLE